MNHSGIVKAIATQSTAVNSLCAGRIYPAVIPQKAAFPAAVVTLISGFTNDTKTSAGDRDTCRVQVDSYAPKLSDADALSDAIRGRLEFFSGLVTVGNTIYTVTSCRCLTPSQTWEDEKELFRVTYDYQLSLERATTQSGVGIGYMTIGATFTIA